jgi:hypothetical protein
VVRGIEIGDAGLLEGGRFRRTASLRDFGIECTTKSSGSGQNVQYTSSHGTKIETGAKANAATLANAEIRIDFAQVGAFVFHAVNLRLHRLENRDAVAQQIMDAYRDDRWDKRWLVIEALHTADSATIIVSEDSSAGTTLAAKAAAIPSLMLADPALGLSVSSTQGKIFHVVAGKDLHPLYSCIRLRDPLFGTPSVEPVRGFSLDSEVALERPALDELLES